MKNIQNLFLCLFALLIFGCSKQEEVIPNDDKLFPVTLNLTTFSAEIMPMASLKPARQINASTTSGKSLSDAIKYLSYAVYNKSGAKINYKSFEASDDKFGTITDALPRGQYTVVVIGSLKGVINLPDDYLSAISDAGTNGLDDIFLGQLSLDVTSEPVSWDFNLKRVVGKIEIVLLDEIPNSIQKITYSVNNVAKELFLNGNISAKQPISNTTFYNNTGSEGDGSSSELSLYFFLGPLQFVSPVEIRAYDHDGNMVAEKILNSVSVAINRKTVLTGRLFENNSSDEQQNFSVNVDDKWNSDIKNVNF